MDVGTILGLGLAFGMIAVSVTISGGSPKAFYDSAAITTVCGGMLAALTDVVLGIGGNKEGAARRRPLSSAGRLGRLGRGGGREGARPGCARRLQPVVRARPHPVRLALP